MKITKTYLELLNFNQIAGTYLDKNKGEDNKICWGIRQFSKQLNNIFEEYNDQRDSLQLDNCSVDEKTKVILKDEKGNRQYTVEAEKKLKSEFKVLAAKTVECHARIAEGADQLIDTLSDIEKEFFSGIVIPEQHKEEE